MKKIVFIILVASLLNSCINQEGGKVKVVTAEEMQSLLELDDVQLVDVRTPKEYKTGYISEAQNIDYHSATFDEDIKNLDKNRPVILYCQSGGRSARCAEKLVEAGFVKVYDLEGGISKWKHKGYEIKNKS
ncbi:MAG: rhodanese-like domain-containing protein [Flavobacteriaceae bacterium]